MIFEADKPVCDGILYDDLWQAPEDLKKKLMARGLVYMTEFVDDRQQPWSGTIVACCAGCARRYAEGRMLNEKVVMQVSDID